MTPTMKTALLIFSPPSPNQLHWSSRRDVTNPIIKIPLPNPHILIIIHIFFLPLFYIWRLCWGSNPESLALHQRDTTGLSSENSELKLRLQAMDQQAHLRDALNEALKQEVERLRVETGEQATHSDAYDMGMHHVHYNPSTFFSHQPLAGPSDHSSGQMQRVNPFQSSTPTHQHHMLAGAHAQDPLGCFQGLDISSRGSRLVKSEGPSTSASESSSGF